MKLLPAVLWVLLAAPQEGRPARLDALGRPVADLPRAPLGSWAGRWEDPARWPAEVEPAYRALLRADLVEGDLVLAFVRARALLAEQPDFPPALFELGVLAFRLQRYGDAVEALRRFLEVAPGEVGRTRALGHALYSLGRYEEALAHYEAVCAARPDDRAASLGHALALWRVGELEAALASLERLTGEDPGDGEALYWRARILLDEDRGEDAELLAAARRARALLPFDPRAAHLAAQVEALLGDPDAARAAGERARSLGEAAARRRTLEAELWLAPADPTTLGELERLELSIGDLAAARAWRERAARAR